LHEKNYFYLNYKIKVILDDLKVLTYKNQILINQFNENKNVNIL